MVGWGNCKKRREVGCVCAHDATHKGVRRRLGSRQATRTESRAEARGKGTAKGRALCATFLPGPYGPGYPLPHLRRWFGPEKTEGRLRVYTQAGARTGLAGTASKRAP